MNKLVLSAVGLSVLALSGCTTTERYVGGGTAIGALGGAAIGAGIGGDTEGALIGGALGAGAGALVGAALDPRDDRYVERPVYGPPVYDRPVYAPSPYEDRRSYRAPAPAYDEQCSYRDRSGQRYIAPCPNGY